MEEDNEDNPPIKELVTSKNATQQDWNSITDKICSENEGTNESAIKVNESQYQVDSFAIIKQSEVKSPLQFHELKSNTNLKDPPSYWLHGLTSIRLPKITPRLNDFSSFLMADQFLDCIGEVDVISDAQNIKKLLKIPYNPKDHVSMMIHRVGKTLLIDEFDIYKYLLRQPENEWKWLKGFFSDRIAPCFPQKQQNLLVRPNKSRDAVQSRNLLSKFLYLSIGAEEKSLPTTKNEEANPISVCSGSNSTKDLMPDPPLAEYLPHSAVQSFTRNIIWNFEDLQMLIGTDLPIFGGRTHPCVSLRLRDMNKPINILTGIDYWLDNLMCNVPEVVMCYHLDGIVQKYELITTEDLPHLPDSQFSPELIRHIAHNILSFLKTKATKEGHTYWLFKGKDDEIVKLYDLTSLCSEESELPSKDETDAKLPFTIPVALLFYRVANNLWQSEDSSSNHDTIIALLKNSLLLLDSAKYPEVFCSAHYILSDMYVPQGISINSPHSDLSDDECIFDDLDDKKKSDYVRNQTFNQKEETKKKKKKKRDNSIPSISASSLCMPYKFRGNKHNARSSISPPLEMSLSDRCEKAIDHVISALDQLQSDMREKEKADVGTCPSQELNEPKMAKPFEPIPMTYSSLKEAAIESNSEGGSLLTKHKESNIGEISSKNSSVPKLKQLSVSVLSTQYSVSSWSSKLKVILLRKAALIFLVKAKLHFKMKRYGCALYFIKMSLHCWRGMSHMLGIKQEEIPLPFQAYSLAGDAYYQLSKMWELSANHIEDFNSMSQLNIDILNILEDVLPRQGYICHIKIPCDVEESMSLSLNAFQIALAAINDDKKDVQLKRRIASISNELGVLYMNQAADLCNQIGKGLHSGASLWKESASYLSKSIQMFREVEDNNNIVLLHNNTGRLYRLCAFYCITHNERNVFSQQERNYYNKALEEYRKASHLIDSCKDIQKDISELISWEYSTTLYNMAILQESGSNDQKNEAMPKDVIELFNNALKQCDLKTQGSRLPLYQYRAADIYLKLAGIYHNALRTNRNREGERSTLKHLAELNYSRSKKLFNSLDSPVNSLKVHLEHVTLLEDWNEDLTSEPHLRSSISLLELLISCQPLLKQISKTPKNKLKSKKEKKQPQGIATPSTDHEKSEEKLSSLLLLYEKKLHSFLLALVKSLNNKNRSESSRALAKKLYSSSLNKDQITIEIHLLNCTSFIQSSFESLKESLKKH